MKDTFSYEESVYEMKISGKQLRKMFKHIHRDETWLNNTEFYQLSEDMHVEYNRMTKELIKLTYQDKDIEDDDYFKVSIRYYDYSNFEQFFGVSLEEIEANQKVKVLATNSVEVLYEYLDNKEKLPIYLVDDRQVFIEERNTKELVFSWTIA